MNRQSSQLVHGKKPGRFHLGKNRLPQLLLHDKIQARMNISPENKIFCLSTDCRIDLYT